MSWKNAADEIKRKLASPPKGTQSIEEIAAELGLGEDRALDIVRKLIKEGRAESVQGKRLSQSGNLSNCLYYRLIKWSKQPKKG